MKLSVWGRTCAQRAACWHHRRGAMTLIGGHAHTSPQWMSARRWCSSATGTPPLQSGGPPCTSTPPAPKLNALSTHVRETFQSEGFTPHASRADRDAALDDVLHAILAPPAGAELHPLLCVRVIEELGCALWDPHMTSGADSLTFSTEGGWLHRVRSYPSLMSGSSLQGQRNGSRTVSRSGHPAADPHALALLSERVTSPLVRLALRASGSVSGGTTRPTQSPSALPAAVRRVLPIVLEWRCTLPSPPATEFSPQEWMPLLLRDAEQTMVSQSPTTPQTASAKVADQALHAVPFPVLAPRVVSCLLAWHQHGADAQDRAEFTVHWVAHVLRLTRNAGGSRIDDAALAQLVFWHGATPLLSHPVVRAALAQALPTCASPSTPRTVKLSVPFSDDEALRRLLLRLSPIATTTTTTGQTSPDAEAVHLLVEPIYVRRMTGSPDNRHIVDKSMAVGTPSDGKEPNEDDTEDNETPLRFIRPLHDYVRLIAADTTASASRPVQLSFTGCVGVLGEGIARLQVLRRESSCNWAHDRRRSQSSREAEEAEQRSRDGEGTARLTLLPHKPRVHALKSTCELLLHNVRTELARAEASAGAATAGTTMSEAATLFSDVPLAQQEAMLRRLCGISRALVRVAMEEKSWSISHEGAEGAALVAGGAQHRGVAGPASPGAARSGGDALGHVLRNAAHRVMEPALRAYYEATVYQAPPVQLTFADLESILGSSSSSASASSSPASDPFGSAGLTGTGRGRASAEWFVEGLRDRYGDVYEAMHGVDHAMGGRDSARRTALQLLHPRAHPSESTALEAIRLLALTDLIVPAPHAPLSDNNEESVMAMATSVEPKKDGVDAENTFKVMDLLLNTFFPLWQQATMQQEEEDAQGNPLHTGKRVVAQSLLLVVLLWMRVCCLREPWLCAQSRVLASWASLESLLTCDGTVSVWTLVGLEALLPALEREPLSSLVRPPSDGAISSFHSSTCRTCGDLLSAARTTLWAAAEELDAIVDSARTNSAGAVPQGDVTWRWLGSTAAVKDALRELDDAVNNNNDAFSLTEEGAANTTSTTEVQFFLLPWSTLATSRQPLCFYDEGSRSAAAVDQFDHDLQRLLTYCRGGETDHDSPGVAAVVRLVALPEELTLYAKAHHCAASTIPGTRMTVVHPEVGLEKEVLGLRAARADPVGTGAFASTNDMLFDESEYDSAELDGLD